MVKKLLVVFLVIIVVLVIVIAAKPSDFRFSRSVVINAKSEIVFAKVNNFHNWEIWSPWSKIDPNAKSTYEGPTTGVGATFKWAGNDQVGEGSETIIKSEPNTFIQINLEFLKPFKATNMAEFSFKSEGHQTIVTWVMYGKNNFVGKAMSLFMDCDKLVGSQFEKGLAQLKAVSEQSN